MVIKQQSFLTVKGDELFQTGLDHREKQIASARYENTPIGCLAEDFFTTTDWSKRLYMWCSYAGVRDLPDQMTEVFLVETLTNEFSGLTLEEVEVAIRMNVLGEFEPPVKHFNLFNVSFLADLIKQYKHHRLEADKKYQQVRFLLEKPKAPELSEFAKDMITAEGVYDDYMRYCAGEEIFGHSVKYDFLERIGLFGTDQYAFGAALSLAKQKIEHDFEHTTVRDERKRLGTTVGDEMKLTLSATIIAKAMLLTAWFYQIKKSDIDFADALERALSFLHKQPVRDQQIPNAVPTLEIDFDVTVSDFAGTGKSG